jgi:hypothetical protein
MFFPSIQKSKARGKEKGKLDSLHQRSQHKLSLLDRLVRHPEPPLKLGRRAVHDGVVVKENVEVDDAGAVPERLCTASGGFNRFEKGKERKRGECGGNLKERRAKGQVEGFRDEGGKRQGSACEAISKQVRLL